MIFVVVGTQLPFDRLVQAVDAWAGEAPRGEILAQVADGTYSPKHIRWERTIAPQEFRACIEQAHLIVAHAGMGTILSALELGKPVIVLPRQARYGEHRNDHQLATAAKFGSRQMVQVAQDETQLREMLNQFEQNQSQTGPGRITADASPELIGNLRKFIEDAAPDRRRVQA